MAIDSLYVAIGYSGGFEISNEIIFGVAFQVYTTEPASDTALILAYTFAHREANILYI